MVKNYKMLKNVMIPLNPDVNIFIGDNDSEKSTILEALCILTTGKLNGYAFERQLKVNMFTNTVRTEYIRKIQEGEHISPPEIFLKRISMGIRCTKVLIALYIKLWPETGNVIIERNKI